MSSLCVCYVFISVMRDFDILYLCLNAVNVRMLQSMKELPHWELLMPNRNKTIGLESKVVLLNLFFFFFFFLYNQVCKQDTNCQFISFIVWTLSSHTYYWIIQIHIHTLCVSCQIDYKGQCCSLPIILSVLHIRNRTWFRFSSVHL